MSKFAAITFVVVFLLVNIDSTVKTANTYDVFREINDRIFAVVDDLFVTLRINTKMIKRKNVEEYMALHSFIQDVLHKNQGRYKEIRNKIETTISNKTADQVSGVNEVIDEMIREQSAKNISSIRNNNKTSNTSAPLKGFVDLAKLLNMKTKALMPNDFTLWSSNSSKEVDGRRIFAGSKTGIARYPFMVSVHVAGRFVCAGSLLHESLALSAASCLMRVRDELDVPIQIRIGSDYVTKMGNLVNVDRITFHPDFDRSTLANNLVLLKTRKSLRFIHRKVVAMKYDKWDSVLRDAKDIVILGWGRRGPWDKNNDDQPLSRARLNLYDFEECKYIYAKDYVTDKTFCAGFVDRGEGACNHDGGGPALVGSLLAGVVSFGSPRCGRVDAPTVFTRLGRYSDWIDSVLDSVTIAKGELANTPVKFEVPASFEVGVGSEEMDAEKSGPENPRDILDQEFGIKDILHGPIDTSMDGKLIPTKANIELESDEIDIKKSKPGYPPDILVQEDDVTGILNGPIDKSKSSIKPNVRNTILNASSLPPDSDTSEKDGTADSDESKNTDEIELSDESEELKTVTPEEHTLPVLENQKTEDKQDQSMTLSNIMKYLYESELLKGGMNIETNMQKDNEEITIANTDTDSENELTTTTPPISEHKALRIGNQVTEGHLPIEREFKLNFATNNAKTKEKLKSLETQFDVQYQVEIKPIFVPKGKKEEGNNNSLIILSESGTTQRIAVKNAEILKNKLKTAMKALGKHMNYQ